MNGRSSIGPYLIEGLLGSGGIGQVYAALDQDLGRRVALKALRPEYSHDPDLLERFRNEAASLARLSHPNITMLYSLFREVEAERQSAFMVMEIINGETLEALLRRLGRISTRGSLAVMAQAGLGLSYAHAAGIIHRDVKPSNLMVNEAGLLKITDFGIARVQGSQRLTRHGTLVGTLNYIAPEQIKGHEADERSDLYSLACVLYELLSGEKPFSGATEYELIRAQLEAEARPLTETMPELEPEVAQAVSRALAKDPNERFPTVAEFAHAIGATAMNDNAAAIVQAEVLALAGPPQVPAPADEPRSGSSRHSASSIATLVADGPFDQPRPGKPRSRLRLRTTLGVCAAVVLTVAVGGYVTYAVRPEPDTASIAMQPPVPPDPPTRPSAAAPPSAPAVVAPAPVANAPPTPSPAAPSEAPAQPVTAEPPATQPPAAQPPASAADQHDAEIASAPEQETNPPPTPDNTQPQQASSPPPDEAPDTHAVAGHVSALTSEGWPVVAGVTVPLEGISRLAPGEGKPVASWIAAHGNYLACTAAAAGAYRCLTQQNLDLVQAILLNGAARTATDALPIYRTAEAQARAARRGLWR